MKREVSSPARTTSPLHKKMRTSPEDSETRDEDEVDPTDFGTWTKVEKRKKKKKQKAEAKVADTRPHFRYNLSNIQQRRSAVGIDEIRELVLHIVADATPPSWVEVNATSLIERTVVLLLPGLTPNLLGLPPPPTSATSNPDVPVALPRLPLPKPDEPLLTLPFIATTFSHACPTRATGDRTRMHSILSTFFHGPISVEERERRRKERATNSELVTSHDPMQYLLTLEQMVENDFPIPSYMADIFEKPAGWVETPFVDGNAEGPSAQPRRVYAIDCEMCVTEDGKELTRICIIDFHTEKLIYDKLVKPSKPIVDYLTKWSGITADALKEVTTTLKEVQDHVLRLLSPPAPNPFSVDSPPSPGPFLTPILLGHSLENDLRALKLCHPLCIDTAIIYHHPRGHPLKPGLAWLVKRWCNRIIQARGEGGHNPEEDARACLELLKKKLELGPSFGEFKTDQESIFERMARSNKSARGVSAGGFRSAVVDYGKPTVMHGSKATTVVACEDDSEVLRGLLDVIPSHHFTFGRFHALASALGWITPKSNKDELPAIPALPPSPETLASALEALDRQLKTLYSALPPRTAVVLLTGHSDPRTMVQLNARKSAFEAAIASGKTDVTEQWTTQDVRDLESAAEVAKRGLLFLGVKP